MCVNRKMQGAAATMTAVGRERASGQRVVAFAWMGGEFMTVVVAAFTYRHV